MMPISEVFKGEAKVIARQATIQEAAQLMEEECIGSVIVVESDKELKPVGMITDRDIVLKTIAHEKDPHEMRVEDVMSADLLTLSQDQRLDEALEAMRSKCVRRAPIVNEEGKVCGLASVDDLLVTLTGNLNTLANLVKEQVKAEQTEAD